MDMHELATYITDIPDYPEPGVVFKDITPLFANPDALAAAVHELSEHFKDCGVTKVVGPEARGFMVGVPVALALGAGFVPARKPGKLPRATISQSYELEYGTDTLEIHADALDAHDKVLVIDDLMATGGTLSAVGKLVESTGATLVGFGSILELTFLNPRAVLETPEHEVWTLIEVD